MNPLKAIQIRMETTCIATVALLDLGRVKGLRRDDPGDRGDRNVDQNSVDDGGENPLPEIGIGRAGSLSFAYHDTPHLWAARSARPFKGVLGRHGVGVQSSAARPTAGHRQSWGRFRATLSSWEKVDSRSSFRSGGRYRLGPPRHRPGEFTPSRAVVPGRQWNGGLGDSTRYAPGPPAVGAGSSSRVRARRSDAR